MKKSILTTLACCCILFSNHILAQETFNVMFYNVLNYPLQQPASRIQHLETILDDYQPDLFMICELNNEEGADNILAILQAENPSIQRALFVPNTSDDDIGNQNDLQNMVYYDSSKFILESQTEVSTLYRDFNHYTLKLNTTNQNTNPIRINVFVTHLKSSSGTDNQNIRLAMVNDFVDYLETLPSDSYNILGGDLNLYTNSEPAYQELLDNTNNITFVDPINRSGSWHNNINYLDVFTQSTRTQSGLGGATGGFDDRFDFILTSENMLTNPDIFYVNDSYQVYGNNNNVNCFNSEINSNDCAGSDFNATIRNALYYFSDHLPVTLQLQTNESLSIPKHNVENNIAFIGGNLIDNKLELNIKNAILGEKKIAITNTLGQQILEINTNNNSRVSIDVSNLSSGIYYVISQQNIKPLKFIKL
ncbi:T9SS type A sorting domain-containing protein [Pontimicrobium sp. IMCC45349]|uniref:T9SS type A sorting domain-containing protein n=1 Tax=Pontimicrobium sp. IMCC45349 TaxID=3391574 RepID=UPI00399FF2F4